MKVTVLYSEECPHCHALLESFKKNGPPRGMELDLVNVDSDKGKQLVKKHNITAIPMLLNSAEIECSVEYVDGHAEVFCPQ